MYEQWLTNFLDWLTSCLSPSHADQPHLIGKALQNQLNILKNNRKPMSVKSTSLFEMRDLLCSVIRVEEILNEYWIAPQSSVWKRMAVEFLQQRAERILNSSLCYTFHSDLPVNDLCITLAKLCDPLSQNSLLMPEVRKEDIYGNNLDELSLGQFILTDDKLSFISLCDIVDTAFSRSVDVETNIYLTTTAEGQSRALSNTEIQRLKTIYPRLEKIRHQLNDKGFLTWLLQNNLYDELINLRNGLRDGDVNHEGHEMNAGAAANVAIVRFRQEYENWSEAKNKQVRAISANGRNLGEIFDIIFRDPNQARHNKGLSVIYCMQLVGSRLEDILRANRITLQGINDSQQERINKLKNQLLEDIRTKKWMSSGADECPLLNIDLTLLMDDVRDILSKKPQNLHCIMLMTNMVDFVYRECERLLSSKRFDSKLDAYISLLLAIGVESACLDRRSEQYNKIVLNEVFKRISLLSSSSTSFILISKPKSKNNWQQWIQNHSMLQSYPFLIDGDCEYVYIDQYVQAYQATGQRNITNHTLSELHQQELKAIMKTADTQLARSKSIFRSFYPASAHATPQPQALYNFDFYFYISCLIALTTCSLSLMYQHLNQHQEDMSTFRP